MSHKETVTKDLTEFGSRERKIAKNLLKAWREQGLPEGFKDEGVAIWMNKNSGYVFLGNSQYQVAMLNGDKLESFYSCPECGHEGFLEDMKHNDDNKDCQEYMKYLRGE